MSGYVPLFALYDGESEAYAKDIWTTIGRRAKKTDDIRLLDEWGSADEWSQFCWKELAQAEIRSFDGDGDADGTVVPDLPHAQIRCKTDPFLDALDTDDEPKLAESAVDVLELVDHAFAAGSGCPEFVYGVSEPHQSRLANGKVPPPVTLDSLADDRIEYACWLMGFPPSMVETYGRETLLSAPAWQTSELSNGGVVVLTTENPTNVSKPETRAIDQRLGLDPPPETEECRY